MHSQKVTSKYHNLYMYLETQLNLLSFIISTFELSIEFQCIVKIFTSKSQCLHIFFLNSIDDISTRRLNMVLNPEFSLTFDYR